MSGDNGSDNGSSSDNGSADKLSKVEEAKLAGDYLRGGIAETLGNPEAASFTEPDCQLLKFHGIYQQDDRDQRIPRRKQGLDKAWMFMIRVGPPGGEVAAAQYLAMDDLADERANGTLRITNRQAFQFHGVLKGNLKATMADIQKSLMTSLAACGDIPRNFLAPPAPIKNPAYQEAQRLARDLKQELAPATGAYVQIWLDGERLKQEEETFYGKQYLPRKFKVAVALDVDNSIDVYANDCGLIGITAGGDSSRGYNLTVGGGFGMTHRKADTIARLATPIAFVKPENAKAAVWGVLELFRDCGNREDRRHARLKYLIEEWGVDRFRAELQQRVDFPLEEPAPMPRPFQHDHMGRHEQGDGREFYGVYVENGRVADFEGGPRYKTAFRTIVERFNCPARLTALQSILFIDLEPGQVDELIGILQAHNIRTIEEISNVRRYSMACPALPTCGLAMSDSERIMPRLMDMLEAEFAAQGLADTALTVRMTGCPNGCARPYNADIGLVGRKPGVYHLFVGGGLAGNRIADLYAADVSMGDITSTLRPLLAAFKAERSNGESLSDFYRRKAGRADRTLITGDEAPTMEVVDLTVSVG